METDLLRPVSGCCQKPTGHLCQRQEMAVACSISDFSPITVFAATLVHHHVLSVKPKLDKSLIHTFDKDAGASYSPDGELFCN